MKHLIPIYFEIHQFGFYPKIDVINALNLINPQIEVDTSLEQQVACSVNMPKVPGSNPTEGQILFCSIFHENLDNMQMSFDAWMMEGCISIIVFYVEINPQICCTDQKYMDAALDVQKFRISLYHRTIVHTTGNLQRILQSLIHMPICMTHRLWKLNDQIPNSLQPKFISKQKKGENLSFLQKKWACIKVHSDIIKILIENASVLSIDTNAKTNSGRTAFHMA